MAQSPDSDKYPKSVASGVQKSAARDAETFDRSAKLNRELASSKTGGQWNRKTKGGRRMAAMDSKAYREAASMQSRQAKKYKRSASGDYRSEVSLTRPMAKYKGKNFKKRKALKSR